MVSTHFQGKLGVHNALCYDQNNTPQHFFFWFTTTLHTQQKTVGWSVLILLEFHFVRSSSPKSQDIGVWLTAEKRSELQIYTELIISESE